MSNFSELELEQALRECAAEPIHQIGAIQPQGALLVLSPDRSRTILQSSANLAEFLELPPGGSNSAIGAPIAALIGADAALQVEHLIELARAENTVVGKIRLGAQQAAVDLLAHVYPSDGVFVLEVEHDQGVPQETRLAEQLFKMQQNLLIADSAKEIFRYFEQIAKLVRTLTNYDSVMIYRFDSNFDGEIIIQERAEAAPSYLGLHFPASDIPPQARHLYTVNLVRVIADVDATPVPILPSLNPATGLPLDMTYSALRSLSPIHLEYLRNMGVHASMVISLLQNGRLWGMIACHHQSAKAVSLATREAAIFISKMASARLSSIDALEERRQADKANQIVSKLLKLITSESVAAILDDLLPEVMGLMNANAILMMIEGKPHIYGDVPPPTEVAALLTWLTTQASSEVFTTDFLAKQFAPAAVYAGIAAGVLMTPLTSDQRNCIVWLRKEKPRTVHWAGSAQKGVVQDASGSLRLTPRKSFELWTESWRGHSIPWTHIEIGIATSLALAIPECLAQKYRLEQAQEGRQHAEQTSAAAQQQLEFMTAAVPGVVYQFLQTPAGTWSFPFLSKGIEDLFEVSAEAACLDHNVLTACVVAEDAAALAETVATSANTLGFWSHEYRIRTASGKLKWVRGQAQPQRRDDGSVLWNGILLDITERKQAEETLRVSESRFKTIFAQAPLGIAMIDSLTGHFHAVNPMFAKIAGRTVEELSDIDWMRITHADDLQKVIDNTALMNAHAIPGFQMQKRHLRPDGSISWVNMTVAPIYVVDDAHPRHLCMIEDISERKAAADKIEYLAFYDSLTRLPNRKLMLDRLVHAQSGTARHHRHGALMLIDLDNFKTLNDTLGHDVGDQLLIEVASRLQSCLRDGDTAARLGGDEFVVILEDLDESDLAAMQAEDVAVKIQNKLGEAYLLNVILPGDEPAKRTHRSTCSIGITLFSDQSVSVDELMKRADTAMYQAKAAGRNTLRFFDPHMQAVVAARAALEDDLRKAIVEQQFLLHYQLQVDSSFNVIGAEALIRWQHPKRGMVSPAEFIPLAEESGLILPIGYWVLETACRLLAAWANQPELAHLTLSVNISARQFSLPNIVEQILTLVEHTGAPPSKLKLELTESLLLENAEDIIAKMTTLKAQGVGFSLDDFGTGYSSLSYLKRLPLDQLKIDQSFVRDILTDPNDAAIARTIIALGQTLGLAVIAEGVETEAQRSFLASAGCDAYQGYLFGRPLPQDAFETLIKRLLQLQAPAAT